MTARQIKKQAKNFLNGKKAHGVAFVENVRYPRTDGTVAVTEMIPVSVRFERAVYSLLGGIPCHWDSPWIVEIDDGETVDGYMKQYLERR